MKGIVLYQSKYGATRRYAEWIAAETGFDCVETGKAKIEDVMQYDTVILGGGVYASGIAGLSFLRKNIAQLRDKKVAVFCVGASPYEEKAFRLMYEYNMKGALAGLPCFYCRGAWDPENMTFVHRTLCRMLRKSVAKKDPEEYDVWEKALIEAGEEKYDWTDRAYIGPILEAVR